MATYNVNLIPDVWNRITNPGESGTSWKKTGGTVIIDHTDKASFNTLPIINEYLKIDKSKRIPVDKDDDDVLTLIADNSNDRYYALILDSDLESEQIIVDTLGVLNIAEIVFVIEFETGVVPEDLIDGSPMTTILEGGRPDKNGLSIDENIPSIINNILRSTSAYDNLIKKSEDISDPVWDKSAGSIVTGTYKWQAQALNDRLRELFTTVDSELYTLSFVAYIETGGQTSGYEFYHFNSESGNTTAITLSEIPDLYEVTVLGQSGGGSISCGIRDINTSNWAEITITDFQVTQSSYPQDYVKTESLSVAVPLDNSHDDAGTQKGNFFQGMAANFTKLFDVLDGKVADDAVEIFENTNLEVDDTGWSVLNSDETTTDGRNTTNPISGIADYKLSVTSAGTSPTNPIIEVSYTGPIVLLAKAWEICFDYKVNSGVCILEAVKNGGNGTRKVVSERLTGVGTFTTRVKSDDPDDSIGLLFQQLQFDGRNEFEIQIDNISMKLISDAKGALHIPKMSFGFNQGDESKDINILDLNQDGLWLIYDDAGSQFKITDGTNTAVVSHTAVADATFSLKAEWNGSRLVIAVSDILGNDIPGTSITFAGRFPIGSATDDDNMAIGWGSELFRIHKENDISIIFYDEPQNVGWL